MAAFTVGMCVVPYYAGKVVMAGTNMSTEEGSSLEQQLRARQTLEHKVSGLHRHHLLLHSPWYRQPLQLRMAGLECTVSLPCHEQQSAYC